MKKNIIIMAAALFAANGLWAIGPQFVNESPNTVSVNGALWQDYTVAGKGAQVIVSSNVRQNVKRGNTINFETGIQDYLTVRYGNVENKRFVPSSGIGNAFFYDMRTFKTRFSRIKKVTFDGVALTVEGEFKGKADFIDNQKKNLKDYCDRNGCVYDGKGNKVTNITTGKKSL